MNYRMIINTIGRVLAVETVLLLLPFVTAILYQDSSVSAFLITILITAVASIGALLVKVRNRVIYAKEGFTIVAFAWILVSIFGAIPFYISGAIPSFIDSLFETISGFTTTGASILTEIETLPKGILFWRSFTHWIGGMGVLVFVMAIVPLAGDRSIHVMRAEVPGPTMEKLVPRIKGTAKLLYRPGGDPGQELHQIGRGRGLPRAGYGGRPQDLRLSLIHICTVPDHHYVVHRRD